MNKVMSLLVGGILFSSAATANDQPPSVAVEYNLVPLMQALVKSKNLSIEVKGSGDVPFSITNDQLKMGISSRKWKDREVAQFVEKNGYQPTELYFTADVIAIFANPKNEATSISIAELKKIFGCNSQPEVVRWRDSEGNQTVPMVPFAIDGQLVMHKEFSRWVSCSDNTFSSTGFVVDQDAFVDAVDSQVGSIGYSVYTDNFSDANILKVTTNFGESYDVNKETILSGRYPLASVYYMYLDLPPNREYFNEQEEFFIGLTLSEEEKPTLNQYGFISLPPEAIDRNRIRLNLEKPRIEGGYK